MFTASDLPPPPSRQSILADFRRLTKRGDHGFQAERVVSRWIRCGYDINELPALMKGLSPEIMSRGIADANQRMAGR